MITAAELRALTITPTSEQDRYQIKYEEALLELERWLRMQATTGKCSLSGCHIKSELLDTREKRTYLIAYLNRHEYTVQHSQENKHIESIQW